MSNRQVPACIPHHLQHPFLQLSFEVHVPDSCPPVAVGAPAGVHPRLEEPLGLLHGRGAVEAGEGRQVELEPHAHGHEPAVVVHVHVPVPLGVRQEGPVAGSHRLLQERGHPDGRVPGRGFHEDGVTFHREQVPLLQVTLIEGVEHVLGCQVEPYRACVEGLQLGEPGLQAFRGVGHVLCRVRRQPKVPEAALPEEGECLQRLGGGLHAVVHAPEDVAVPVGGPAEHPAVMHRGLP